MSAWRLLTSEKLMADIEIDVVATDGHRIVSEQHLRSGRPHSTRRLQLQGLTDSVLVQKRPDHSRAGPFLSCSV